MKIITQEDIKNINIQYKKLGTYAATARATGFSPGTVKKYVKPDFEVIEDRNVIHYTREHLPNFEPEKFRAKDWGELCVLSSDELKDVYELWKEIEL